MTTKSDIISTFDNEQFEDEEPIIIKTSITKELYHGNKLKSRIEMSGSREFPGRPMNEENVRNFNRRIPKQSNLKEYNIDMQQKRSDHTTLCWIIFFVFILAFSLLLGYYLLSDELPLGEIENELHAKVLNQDIAISKIMTPLSLLRNNYVIILPFLLIGPTGVGKSHIINILKERISSKHLKVFYRSDLNDFIEKKRYFESSVLDFRFYKDDYLIIVFEDLVRKDLDKLYRFMDLIESANLKILVFAVFNAQNKECLQQLSIPDDMSFTPEDFPEKDNIVKFDYLNETTVRRWLKKTLEGKKVNIKFHDEIMNKLLSAHDIKCHGLKGLHSKLLLE